MKDETSSSQLNIGQASMIVPVAEGAVNFTVEVNSPIYSPFWNIVEPKVHVDDIFEGIYKHNRELIHYRVADNCSACLKGGDKHLVDVWGHYLTENKSLVGCHPCLEWLYA